MLYLSKPAYAQLHTIDTCMSALFMSLFRVNGLNSGITIHYITLFFQLRLCANACLLLPKSNLFFLVSMFQLVMQLDILRGFNVMRDTVFVLTTKEYQTSQHRLDLRSLRVKVHFLHEIITSQ